MASGRFRPHRRHASAVGGLSFRGFAAIRASLAAASSSTQSVEAVLSDANSGAPWRKTFGIDEPSSRLAAALGALAAVAEEPRIADRDPLTRLAGRILASVVESRELLDHTFHLSP